MINHRLFGISVLLGTAVTAFATAYIPNENESIEVSCCERRATCFEETCIGYRYLYGKSSCIEALSEQIGFVN